MRYEDLSFGGVSAQDEPEIIECELRLHFARPEIQEGTEPVWADWSETVVGEPVTFRAVAITGKGAWNGPLQPGAAIASPKALLDPWWTIFLPNGRGVPIKAGQVGYPLAIGDEFNLPPGHEGVWEDGVEFTGAIVVD